MRFFSINIHNINNLCFLPLQTVENSEVVDLRHFAFYAFAGRSGQLRWNRKNEVPFVSLLFMLFLLRCCVKLYPPIIFFVVLCIVHQCRESICFGQDICAFIYRMETMYCIYTSLCAIERGRDKFQELKKVS